MVLAYDDYSVGMISGLSIAFGILLTKLPESKPGFLFTIMSLNFMLGGYRYGKTKMIVAFLANLFCISFDYLWYHFGYACSMAAMNSFMEGKNGVMQVIYEQWPFLKKLTGAGGGSMPSRGGGGGGHGSPRHGGGPPPFGGSGAGFGHGGSPKPGRNFLVQQFPFGEVANWLSRLSGTNPSSNMID